MRFQISRAGPFRWLLSAFSATEARSFIAVEPDALDIRFGFFHQRVARREVKAVRVEYREVPWYRLGIGWRTNFAGRVGLIGSPKNLVLIELSRPRRMFIGVSVVAKELLVSLDAPDQFVAAVRA